MTVPDTDENEAIGRLEQFEERLSKSRDGCRTILHDCEVQRAANANDAHGS